MLLVPNKEYNKYLVPSALENGTEFSVKVSYSIRAIMYIDENENFIRISSQITKDWFDSKLIFKNLKKHPKNLVHSEEQNSIWTPWIVDLKTDTKEKCKRGTEQEVFEIISNDDDIFKFNSLTNYENAFLYEVCKKNLTLFLLEVN